MTEEELKLIEQMARKAALASFLGAENVGGNLMETLLVQKIANDFQTMSNFKKDNTLPTNTKQIIESITPQTPIQKENITPQINEELETPYTLKGKILHSENPITGVVNKIKSTFEKPKHRELSEIPTEIHDPNQWHIDSAPLEIQHKPRNLSEVLSDEVKKYKGLGPIEALQKAASKFPFPNTEAEYYGISTKMADGEDMTKRAKEQNTFYKLKDIKDPEIAKNLREKMAKSKGLDINNPNDFEEIQNTKVVVPKVDSDLYKHAKNSKTTKQWVADNYDKFENKTIENKDKHITYPKSIAFPDKRALYLTINNADLTTSKVNKNKSMVVSQNDVYDFKDMQKEDLKTFNPIKLVKNIGKNVITNINNKAFSQQEKGQLEPYGLSMPIYYTPEEIEEIKKKYRKKHY